MRIEILSHGGGSIVQTNRSINNLYDSISDTISELTRVNTKLETDIKGGIYSVTGGTSYLALASSKIASRISSEQSKLAAVSQLSTDVSAFFENTIEIDKQVANTVKTNEKDFFDKNPDLKPTNYRFESWWDKITDWFSNTWDAIEDAIEKCVFAVIDFIKNHAVQLIVGTVFLVLGAVLVAFTAGTGAAFLGAFLAALAEGFVSVLISSLISALISSVIALIFGGDVKSAFSDGLADGYMFGGIFFCLGKVFNIVKSLFTKKDVVTYYRVQGGQGPNPNDVSRYRVDILDDGSIKINGDKPLNVSADGGVHAEGYLKNNRPGGEVYEWDMPKWFDDMVNEYIRPQANFKSDPLNQGGLAPSLNDPTKKGVCYEFRSMLDWIEEYATNGRVLSESEFMKGQRIKHIFEALDKFVTNGPAGGISGGVYSSVTSNN